MSLCRCLTRALSVTPLCTADRLTAGLRGSVLIGGFFSAAARSVIETPLELMKVRRQTQQVRATCASMDHAHHMHGRHTHTNTKTQPPSMHVVFLRPSFKSFFGTREMK